MLAVAGLSDRELARARGRLVEFSLEMFESMASSPEEFSQYIKAEIPRWAKVMHEQNLSVE